MKYTHVFFDLDGTLTDSGEGIRKGVAYALAHYGITDSTDDFLNQFIGPPLEQSFCDLAGLDAGQAHEALRLYRVYYFKTGVFENLVYDGVEEALKALKESGCILTVATSKPQVLADMVLEHFHLKPYFDFIQGAELDGTHVAKADVVRLVKEHYAGLVPEHCLMVGDRSFDVLGAAQNHIDCAGVLWGYGSRQEFSDSGAAVVVETPAQLVDWICRS